MPIQAPNIDQIFEIAEDFGLDLSLEDAHSFTNIIEGIKASFDHLDTFAEPKLPVKYSRQPGYQPSAEENLFNGWYWKTDIQGAKNGSLSGKKVAIKDNICVAGVPMMNGSRVLEGYVPEIDATVVTRILDAGGHIVGKAASEDLCISGASHTNKLGVGKNPHKPDYSAGGSSSGSGILLATGEVDLALGGDQGGSIRMPASWCGVYGLKPTHGLVPYTGIFPIEFTMDHVGPMANSVEDTAKLLSVIAGTDGHDPRQINTVVQDYLQALEQEIKGMKIAVLKEGFNRPESEETTDIKVRDAIKKLETLGASIEEVSIPMHLDGLPLWNVLIIQGCCELMIKGNALGTNWDGYFPTSLLDSYAQGWRSRPNDLSETVKIVLLTGEYVHRYYHGRYYAKGQNIRQLLRKAYDSVLENYDLLVMPTIPFRATKTPPVDCSREEYFEHALNMLGNTCPFDLSSHPAMSIPCGIADDLPIGMMLVAKRYDEASIFRAAHAFENSTDWKNL